ncbi:MAG: hypothetical protein FWC13_06655 [Oscillospiraceae bacterium]|nr:hypothetical protein [Oscillospiraceae bacterium]
MGLFAKYFFENSGVDPDGSKKYFVNSPSPAGTRRKRNVNSKQRSMDSATTRRMTKGLRRFPAQCEQ